MTTSAAFRGAMSLKERKNSSDESLRTASRATLEVRDTAPRVPHPSCHTEQVVGWISPPQSVSAKTTTAP